VVVVVSSNNSLLKTSNDHPKSVSSPSIPQSFSIPIGGTFTSVSDAPDSTHSADSLMVFPGPGWDPNHAKQPNPPQKESLACIFAKPIEVIPAHPWTVFRMVLYHTCKGQNPSPR